ncbi:MULTISPECIES: helix-turn-helix transcriptional regulator [unclassified Streptomyces]|uniref:helix-turn-helix domain-containing protein n=1 Tax=unclassified Streptomyces TaxID=2593676 RepID=UPI00202465AE|nr:helix-turn-helix transcriptional regulator [Streptomyces sp. A 4/2]
MANAYGDWVKQQREAAGLTQQALADAAVMTRSHISHIEAGRRIPCKEDAKRLDLALNTGNVLLNFLPSGDERAVADHFEAARQLEQQATVIREFDPSIVPGLLQTEAYAQAVLRTSYPPLSDAERDRAVVTRLERAEVLSGAVAPVLWVLLDEAVIRRPFGDPGVMAEQLTRIADLIESERIRLHVLPFSMGGYMLLQSALKLMWFEDQPPVAYVEGLFAGKVHDSPSLVQRYQATYDLALGDALPLKETLALLRATAKEYEDHDN